MDDDPSEEDDDEVNGIDKRFRKHPCIHCGYVRNFAKNTHCWHCGQKLGPDKPKAREPAGGKGPSGRSNVTMGDSGLRLERARERVLTRPSRS